MQLNQLGINLLCINEGFRSCPYLDSKQIPTIGIGTTILPDGSRVTMNTPCISKDTALEYMNHYLQEIYTWIDTNCQWQPNQNEFNALCSFLYNLGIGSHLNNCSNTKRAIINGDKHNIIVGMLSVNNGGLLASRREREVEMFRLAS